MIEDEPQPDLTPGLGLFSCGCQDDGDSGMSDSADPRSIAAHLTAALIASGHLEQAKGGPAVAAARIYFDVLDAFVKEQTRRYAPPTGRTNG
jgi:hypothetical protein